jgi:MFS family permease
MGRKAAVFWHAAFSIAAGFLYFFFVLPRWPELVGDTSHALGTAARIAGGVVVGLAALPVVFTLLRSRKPEFGTPQLALTLRTGSVVAHVLAGVLIVGTAISEIWLSLDSVGQWLFGVYGAAAAIAVLGIVGFYLSFVAELPPPPPKPLKPKKEKGQRGRRKKDGSADEAVENETPDAHDDGAQPAEVTHGPEIESGAAEPDSTASEAPTAEDTEASTGGLQNRRPTGKSSAEHRRRRSRRGVAVED